MKILSITAKKPDSTGRSVFLTELVKGLRDLRCRQAVACGTMLGEELSFPEGGNGVPGLLSDRRIAFSGLRYENHMH